MERSGGPNYELVRRRLSKTRRVQGLTLRDVGDRIGVSAATLSRFEKQKGTPDLQTVERLIAWLDLDRAAVFGARSGDAGDTPAVIRAHLRADQNLEPQAAEALATSFDELYKAFAGGRGGS